jgi:hypothetical protein
MPSAIRFLPGWNFIDAPRASNRVIFDLVSRRLGQEPTLPTAERRTAVVAHGEHVKRETCNPLHSYECISGMERGGKKKNRRTRDTVQPPPANQRDRRNRHNQNPTPFCTLMEDPIEIDAELPPGVEGLLELAFRKCTSTPTAILDLIPSPAINVSSLLEKNLPALLYQLAVNLPSAEACTTDREPSWTVEELFKAPVPPRTWLSDLEIIVRKKWHTCPSVTSVRHPTISGLYLPLWAGNFWYSLIGAVEQKEEWRRAERWLSGQVQGTEVYKSRELMKKIPWGTRIWALTGADSSSVVGVLSRLLSTEWVRERHLDTLASYLNFRARRDKKGAEECWVGDVYLSICLKEVYRVTKQSINDNWDLNKYREAVTGHGYKRLLFPTNLNNNHWIVFGVDLVKNDFCYGASSHSSEVDMWLLKVAVLHDIGDSLGDRVPSTELQHIRRGLKNWLDATFGAPFKDLGGTFLIGRQKDGHSCGICVVNSIEHAMFGVPLFTDKDRHTLRIQYFVEAVKYLLDNVSILCTEHDCTYLFFSLPDPHAKRLLNR